MTYEKGLFAQADLRKLRGSTIERKQMSTKTIYKRIALVAVASLGFGVLTSISPASAAVAANELNLQQAGSTLAVTAVTNIDTAQARAGVQTIVVTQAPAVVAADAYDLYVSTATTAGAITDANTAVLNTPTVARNVVGTDALGTIALSGAAATPAVAGAWLATAGKQIVVTPGAGTTDEMKITFNTASLAAGTWTVWADTTPADVPTAAGTEKVGIITVVDAGAPVTASYSQVGYVDVAAPENITAKLTLKDSSARSTILVGDETVGHTIAKQVPASDATLTAIGATTAAERTLTAGVFAAYDVVIPGGAGGANTPTVGSKYTITSTVLKGASAFGSTTLTYVNVASTLGLTGTVSIVDATTKAVVTSVARAASGTIAGGTYAVVVKDASGAVVVGVTPVATASTGTVTTAIGATDADGSNTAFAYTAPATGGTSTISIALSTGSTSLTTSFSVVVTAFGATAAIATTAVKSVVAANGSGVVMTSTAPTTNAWSAARNVSGFTVVVGGLDAAKAATVTLNGTGGAGTTTPKINGVAAGTDVFPVASAAGEITLSLTVEAAAATGTLVVTVDADGAGGAGAVTVLTITFNDATNTITTDPKSGTLNMSTPSATKVITAAGTDQFKNPITGGSFKLTNTVVPAGATAATAVTVNQSAAGTATLNAVLGATLGTYTFTVDLISVNAAVLATSTINYSVTTTGIAGSLTLTDNDTVTTTATTTDDKSSRTIVVNRGANVVVAGGLTDSATAITVTTATPTGLAFTATATNGIRLFTTTPDGAAITPGLSTVSGTAGASANLWAVPTKVGAGTITVVAGGITKVYTLTGTAPTAANSRSAIVTLTATANAGQYTVKASDAFGNGVVNDVTVSLVGPGTFSNGFKNLTVTTGADGTNTFNVVSDGSAATTITAKLNAAGGANGQYVAITDTEAKAAGLVLTGLLGASTDTTTATLAGKGGDATGTATATSLAALTTLINSLIAKINALNKLVIKIQKKVRA